MAQLLQWHSPAAACAACGSQQRLDLSSLSRHDDPDQVAAWAAEAGQHFPACTAVKCALLQQSDFVLVQNILPTLARLPALNTLELAEAVDDALNSPALAMLCSSIGLQLPRLRRLSLHAATTWVPAGLAWQQLGRITQLTPFDIEFSSVGNKPPFALPDLAALSSLCSLEHLALVTGARKWPLPPAWQVALSFLGDLTRLTHLQLPLWVPAGLASIGRCQKLSCLRLGSNGLLDTRAITPAVFAKLSSCTKLWRLEVFRYIDRLGLGQIQQTPTLSGYLSERVPAVHALAKAQCLECAAFRASADEEVAALACSLKGTPALSELSLAAVGSGQVTCMGLVQVAALRQLRKLSLLLSGTPLSQHGAQMLLCALSHVPEVLLVVREAGHGTVIEAALEACRALGLALPQSV